MERISKITGYDLKRIIKLKEEIAWSAGKEAWKQYRTERRKGLISILKCYNKKEIK